MKRVRLVLLSFILLVSCNLPDKHENKLDCLTDDSTINLHDSLTGYLIRECSEILGILRTKREIYSTDYFLDKLLFERMNLYHSQLSQYKPYPLKNINLLYSVYLNSPNTNCYLDDNNTQEPEYRLYPSRIIKIDSLDAIAFYLGVYSCNDKSFGGCFLIEEKIPKHNAYTWTWDAVENERIFPKNVGSNHGW